MNKEWVVLTLLSITVLTGWYSQFGIVFWLIGVLITWLVFLHFRRWQAWGVAIVVVGGLYLQLYREQQIPQLSQNQLLSGNLQINPEQLSVNGDMLTGNGKFFQDNGTTTKVCYYYRLASKDQQAVFRNLTVGVLVNVEGEAEKIESARNRGAFDAKAYYQSQGIYQRLQVTKLVKITRQTHWWDTLTSMRLSILRLVKSQPDSSVKTYALLLLFGHRKDTDIRLIDDYQELGLLHLLAISGLHVTILVRFLEKFLRRIGITIEHGRIVTALALLVFGWLMNWNVSGTRAILMSLLMMVSKRYYQRLTDLDALCLVTLVSLLWRPAIVLNMGFQLSYGLTAIVLLVSHWSAQVVSKEWQHPLMVMVLVPIVGLPLMSHYFFAWNLLSIILTVGIVFLFERVVLPGLLLYVLGILVNAPWLKIATESCLGMIIGRLHELLSFFARLPIGKLVMGQWQWWEWGIYWAIFIMLAIVFEYRQKFSLLKTVLFLIEVGVVIMVPYHFKEEVVMLDIGQGDAIVIIERGWNQATLVDTGGIASISSMESWRTRNYQSQAKRTLIPSLQAEGLSQLNEIMLSHADYDHIGNLDALLAEMSTHTIIVAQGMENHPKLQPIRKKYPTIIWKIVKAGNRWGKWQILWPDQPSKGSNDDSIIALVTVQGHRLLLTGDAPSAAEEKVVSHYDKIDSDILKVGHHGSKSSTSETLLSHINAQVALISAGKGNHYNHPHEETLQRLKDHHVDVFSTKEDGAIRVKITRKRLELQTTLTKKRWTKSY